MSQPLLSLFDNANARRCAKPTAGDADAMPSYRRSLDMSLADVIALKRRY